MTFDQLLVFHKIVQFGSFKAASDELHKTQPAISFSIKKLEQEMGVELFDRGQYRPMLTHHGKVFYEKSLRLLQGMQDIEGLIQSFSSQAEPEISIAIDGVSLKFQFLRHFKNFSDRFPHTRLNLNFEILSEAERKVLSREAQIGITHFLNERNSLEVIPVTTIKMIPVISRDLYLEKNVTLQAQLLDIDQIVVGDRNGDKGVSFGLLDGGKKWRLMDSNFKREIILSGLGWGHLPEHTIEKELKDKRLIVLNFEDIKPRELEINLIRLKKFPLGPVAKVLWEELKMLNFT